MKTRFEKLDTNQMYIKNYNCKIDELLNKNINQKSQLEKKPKRDSFAENLTIAQNSKESQKI